MSEALLTVLVTAGFAAAASVAVALINSRGKKRIDWHTAMQNQYDQLQEDREADREEFRQLREEWAEERRQLKAEIAELRRRVTEIGEHQ